MFWDSQKRKQPNLFYQDSGSIFISHQDSFEQILVLLKISMLLLSYKYFLILFKKSDVFLHKIFHVVYPQIFFVLCEIMTVAQAQMGFYALTKVMAVKLLLFQFHCSNSLSFSTEGTYMINFYIFLAQAHFVWS